MIFLFFRSQKISSVRNKLYYWQLNLLLLKQLHLQFGTTSANPFFTLLEAVYDHTQLRSKSVMIWLKRPQIRLWSDSSALEIALWFSAQNGQLCARSGLTRIILSAHISLGDNCLLVFLAIDRIDLQESYWDFNLWSVNGIGILFFREISVRKCMIFANLVKSEEPWQIFWQF